MRTTAAKKLEKFIKEQKALMKQRNAVGSGYWVAARRRDEDFKKNCLPKLTQVGVYEVFCQWMKGFLERGGVPNFYYDYTMREDRMYIAVRDFHLPQLCGAASVTIIVPSNVNVTYDDRGHSTILEFKDFKAHGYVSVYKDTKV